MNKLISKILNMKLILSFVFLLTSFFCAADNYFVKSYISSGFTTTDIDGKITHYDKKTEIQVYVIDGREYCSINLYKGENLFNPIVLSTSPLTTKEEDEIVLLSNCEEIKEGGDKLISLLSFHYDLAKSRTIPKVIKFSPVFSGTYFDFMDIEENVKLIDGANDDGHICINNMKLKLPLRVIENPYNYSSKDRVSVTRIYLFNDETIVDFYCNNYADDESKYEYCNINSKSYIEAGGKKYELLKADNIALAPSKTFFDTSKKIDQKNFTLHFKAIPITTSSIDFIEESGSDWNIYDLDVSNSTKRYENENEFKLRKLKIFRNDNLKEVIEDGVLKTCYQFRDNEGIYYQILISKEGEGSAFIIREIKKNRNTNKKQKQLYKAYLGNEKTQLIKKARKKDFDDAVNDAINKAKKATDEAINKVLKP